MALLPAMRGGAPLDACGLCAHLAHGGGLALPPTSQSNRTITSGKINIGRPPWHVLLCDYVAHHKFRVCVFVCVGKQGMLCMCKLAKTAANILSTDSPNYRPGLSLRDPTRSISPTYHQPPAPPYANVKALVYLSPAHSKGTSCGMRRSQCQVSMGSQYNCQGATFRSGTHGAPLLCLGGPAHNHSPQDVVGKTMSSTAGSTTSLRCALHVHSTMSRVHQVTPVCGPGDTASRLYTCMLSTLLSPGFLNPGHSSCDATNTAASPPDAC